MGRAATFSIVAGLSLVGAAAGLHLGRATVSGIDPIFFGETDDPRFHSELVPNRPSTDEAPLSSPEDYAAVPITGCVGCRSFPEEYRPSRDPIVDAEINDYPASVAYAAADYAEPVGEPAPDPEREAVVRYASWAVETPKEQSPEVEPVAVTE
jgi:hypothetical protein